MFQVAMSNLVSKQKKNIHINLNEWEVIGNGLTIVLVKIILEVQFPFPGVKSHFSLKDR